MKKIWAFGVYVEHICVCFSWHGEVIYAIIQCSYLKLNSKTTHHITKQEKIEASYMCVNCIRLLLISNMSKKFWGYSVHLIEILARMEELLVVERRGGKLRVCGMQMGTFDLEHAKDIFGLFDALVPTLDRNSEMAHHKAKRRNIWVSRAGVECTRVRLTWKMV